MNLQESYGNPVGFNAWRSSRSKVSWVLNNSWQLHAAPWSWVEMPRIVEHPAHPPLPAHPAQQLLAAAPSSTQLHGAGCIRFQIVLESMIIS